MNGITDAHIVRHTEINIRVGYSINVDKINFQFYNYFFLFYFCSESNILSEIFYCIVAIFSRNLAEEFAVAVMMLAKLNQDE